MALVSIGFAAPTAAASATLAAQELTMTSPNPMLAPVVALVAWTLLMWLWMYATRIPAILKSRIRLNPDAPRGEQMNQLPPQVRWKADNYNHLMEIPTAFYAIAREGSWACNVLHFPFSHLWERVPRRRGRGALLALRSHRA